MENDIREDMFEMFDYGTQKKAIFTKDLWTSLYLPS